MPKLDVLKRIDEAPATLGGRGPTMLQVSKLNISGPYSGDFQIVNNGRLIVGNDPDTGNRGVLSPKGLFGYNNNGVNVFAAWFAPSGDYTSGDFRVGHPDNNRLFYDQSEATLGLYNQEGAGFIVDSSGSLQAGSSDGALMSWDVATGIWRIYAGPGNVAAEINTDGNALFAGTITATGGSITGDMSVAARLRVGDVDGPVVYLGLEENDANYEYSIIRAHDRENLANFVVRAGQAELGGDGFYFMVGNAGDYSNRMTYSFSSGLVVNGTSIVGSAVSSGNFSGTVGGSLDVGSTGYIKGGATGYDSGTGFWLGYSSGYKLFIGNSAGNKLTWDGSALALTGSVTSTSGTIGGWDISTDYISKGTIKLQAGSDPAIFLGTAYFYSLSGSDEVLLSGSLFAYEGLATNGPTSLYGNLSIYDGKKFTASGEIAHTGNTLGFFSVSPATRPSAYTFSNGSTDRAIDCNSTTLDELADVVYTMWSDLTSLGLLQ